MGIDRADHDLGADAASYELDAEIADHDLGADTAAMNWALAAPVVN